jgi:hypothetical protein
MNRHRAPNPELRSLLIQAGWTGEQLAQMVNRVGAEAGLRLRYDRTSVSHWLAGVRPRAPVPDFIAEALSRGLHRPVTTAAVGFARSTTSAINMRLDTQPDSELGRLFAAQTQEGIHSRSADSRFAYRVGELDVPPWPSVLRDRPPVAEVRQPMTDASVLQSAELMAWVFSASDSAFGGGSARLALSGYLSHDLAPRLGAPGRLSVRRRLHALAAQLAYLCGFMCFDNEMNGLAQRYYLMALSLAAEGNDEASYAITLRAMSVQAQLLGHHREAAHLAETAVTTGKTLSPMRRAFLHGQLAVAQAAIGDRSAALASMGMAERLLGRAAGAAAPLIGAYNLASLSHQQAVLGILLGDRKSAADALALSIRNRPTVERRARAITVARQAELQLRRGDLEEAVHTWHSFLDDYPLLLSGRIDTALRNMRSLLRPYSNQPTAAALLARAETLMSVQSAARRRACRLGDSGQVR